MVVWQAQRVRSAVCKPRTVGLSPLSGCDWGQGVCARSGTGAVRQGSSLPRGVVLKFMAITAGPITPLLSLMGRAALSLTGCGQGLREAQPNLLLEHFRTNDCFLFLKKKMVVWQAQRVRSAVCKPRTL